jgi:midasin (ATPase involved in ribosome maturation)
LKINKENVIQIQLSNSTTIDNLFCKKIPDNSKNTLEFIEEKSKFLLAIDESTSNNDIIIIENLEQASITILEALIPMFNVNSKEQILLPNGKYIKKGIFKLIATFDPTVKGSAFNILPEAIKNNAILFSVPNYSKEDYQKICKNIFENQEEYNEDIQQFINDVVKIQNYIFKNQLKETVSLNDIYKFYLLKNEVQNIFEYELIAKILFIQRFSNLNEIENITKELGYKYDDLWPEFFYAQDEENEEQEEWKENEENNDEYLCVAPFDAEEQIKIKIKGESNDMKLTKIYSLTPEQRICLIFLIICYKSNLPCIIQGLSISGKTHIIKLFFDLINEDLEVIQLNNDSGINVLIGQIELNNELY